MPCLHYSNRLDSLVIPLAESLKNRDPFVPVEIVVPNFSLEKWLSLQLAQINGIAANLRFLTLEKAIFEFIQQNFPDRPFSILKQETTQCLLQEILKEKLDSSDKLWQPIRNFVTPKSELSQLSVAQRLYQLTGRLSRLFLEYEFSRDQEILDIWREGKNAIDPNLEMETWQRSLWDELFGKNGRLTLFNQNIHNPSLPHYQTEIFTLPQLFHLWKKEPFTQKSSSEFPAADDAEKFHIFGISYLSRFHQKTLTEEISQFRDIHVYTLNPCMEYWEDLTSLGEFKSQSKKNILEYQKRFEENTELFTTEISLGELNKKEIDNPFLQAWGRPGRENIRLLNQWTQWDFTPWFIDPAEDDSLRDETVVLPQDETDQVSLLSQLQQDILFREPRRNAPVKHKQDDSLMILSAPSPRREVEAVASLIWDWIQKDSDLKFNDCAVIAHDMELYQHEIEQVFESVHQLPYHLIDGMSGSAGRLQEAAEQLFGLCFTEYNRKDIFSLLNNPCFIHQLDPDQAENQGGESLQIQQWLKWADELNVFFGIDQESHHELGYTYLEKELYHWEQAFRRLTIGDAILDEEMVPAGDQHLIPAALTEDLGEEAARFMLVMRSLIADTKDMQEWEMSATNWGQYLQSLIKTYLKPYDEADQETYQNLLSNVVSLRDLDLGQIGGAGTLGFSSIFEFIKQKQQASLVHRGQYLAEGVTVSSFQPMRPIPFKVVFILGMGEGQFPAPYHRDTLDLRKIPIPLQPEIQGKKFRERLLGDVSMTERDRYMFLETLVSTQKHLVLSYISRNDRTDDELNPSSIILTLLEELNQGYLKNPFQVMNHPLKAYSREYFPELDSDSETAKIKSDDEVKTPENSCTDSDSFEKPRLPNYDPAAYQQACALRIREELDRQFSGLNRLPVELFRKGALKDWMQTRISVEDNDPKSKSELFRLKTSQLRKYLSSPLQSSANYLLRIREDEENLEENIHEPLVLEKLDEWSMIRNVWATGLMEANDPDWLSIYEKHAVRLELEGVMPTGIFRDSMRDRHIRILKNWEFHLKNELKVNWLYLHQNMKHHRFGAGSFSGMTQNNLLQVHPALRISSDSETGSEAAETPFVVELHAETEWILEDPQGNWNLISFKESEYKDKDWLRHFLDILIFCGSEQLPEAEEYNAWAVSAEKIPKKQILEPPDKKAVTKYVLKLVQSMNSADAALMLPIESVLDLKSANTSNSDYNVAFKTWMEQKLFDENSKISSHFGPIKNLEDMPFAVDALQVTKERFNLFFNTFPDL